MQGPAALASELAALGAACVADSGGTPAGPTLRAAWPGGRVAGPAFTVTAGVGDNLALHVACAEADRGSVLVVDASRAPAFGYWGEVLTTAAVARGIAGIVVDGGVRDVDAIAAKGFPMFSSLVAHRGAVKIGGGGSVGGSVTVAGVVVEPGDWVVGDADGVTVVPAASLEPVAAAARARGQREGELFAALAAGATTIDLLGLDPTTIARR